MRHAPKHWTTYQSDLEARSFAVCDLSYHFAKVIEVVAERLGGALKYSDVADKIFRSNLSMIDLHMGRLMAEMTRLMWLDGITKVSELTEEIKKLNPLKIKDELITKHGFYEYKVKELLLALAMGLLILARDMVQD